MSTFCIFFKSVINIKESISCPLLGRVAWQVRYVVSQQRSVLGRGPECQCVFLPVIFGWSGHVERRITRGLFQPGETTGYHDVTEEPEGHVDIRPDPDGPRRPNLSSC